jgi:hypothetical protein
MSAPTNAVMTDALRELLSAHSEGRALADWATRKLPLGTYEQAVEAASLGRQICAEVLSIPYRTFTMCTRREGALVWLCEAIHQQFAQAIEQQNWPEALRWMRASPPIYHAFKPFAMNPVTFGPHVSIDAVPGKTYASAAEAHPTELKEMLPGAFADVLRGVFVGLVPLLGSRRWDIVHKRIQHMVFELEDADLGDTGGPNGRTPLMEWAYQRMQGVQASLEDVELTGPPYGRTPLMDWELHVQSRLDMHPTPDSAAYNSLLAFGRRLRDHSPLSPVLIHAALVAMRSSSSRLRALPLDVRDAILRWAMLPKSKW